MVRGTCGPVPEEALAAAAQLVDRTAHQANRLAGELVTVVEALRAAGVRTLALKGPALATLLDGSPALRAGLDLDLLIAAADLAQAAALLASLGYEARPRADGLARELHFVNHRRGFVVDLHWNVAGAEIPFALDFDELWIERQPVAIAGATIDLPSLPWLAVLSCLYLIKEYPRVELRYLADLELVAARLSIAELSRTGEIATATGTRRIVGLAYLMLQRRGLNCNSPVAPDADTARLTALVERALADVGHDSKRRYWHRAVALLAHARFRERFADRVRVVTALPMFLLRPDMDDLERAAAEGRPAWAVRLARLPEVAADLWSARRSAEDRVVALLADPNSVVRPTPGVELFILDEAGLLLASHTGELLTLTTTATFIWCALEEQMELGRLIAAYGNAFGRSDAVAAGEVRAALSGWARSGLLEGTTGRPRPRAAAAIRAARPPRSESVPADRHYAILGTRFALDLCDRTRQAAADEVLGHFHGPQARADCRVELRPQRAGWSLWIDGERREETSDQGLVPTLKHALIAEAVNRHGFDLLVHAAMLRSGDRALLLPAAPGSGKTCLSLALAAAGFAWHTDETTLLLGEDLKARGVPACPCVKEPAWPLVAPLSPGLIERQIHRRADGKIVRYAVPPCDPRDSSLATPWPVRWLVFPRYVGTGGTRLVRLERIEALRRLLSGDTGDAGIAGRGARPPSRPLDGLARGLRAGV